MGEGGYANGTLMTLRCACGDEATANGRECGRCFLRRLRSLQFSSENFETKDKRNYYDSGAVTESFGDDSEAKMLDQTQGLGYIKTGPDGLSYRKDRKNKEWVRVTEKELDQVYLGGRTEEDG